MAGCFPRRNKGFITMISKRNLQVLHKQRSAKKKIVLVGGCFDILHPGHITYLTNSKKLGDYLVVLLESDESVKKAKKVLIQPQEDRQAILSNLEMVDLVIPLRGILDDKDYYMIVKMIKPDIIAITENDAQLANKKRQANEFGADLITATKRIKKYSSSELKKKVQK